MSAQTSARPRAAQVSRRTALVATSTGLALTIAAPVAMAATGSPAQVDVKSATQGARAALAVQPTVVVPQDAEWTLPSAEVTGTKPAPPPPVVERGTSASRSSARAAASAAPAASAAAPSVSGNAVLSIAYRYIGVPYVSGGSTPAGFDCSGFTQYVYAQLGISLPRSSSAQRYAGTVVSADQARPGDLIWWPGHVGIYAGDGQYIGARQPGTPLKVSPIYRSGGIFIRVS